MALVRSPLVGEERSKRFSYMVRTRFVESEVGVRPVKGAEGGYGESEQAGKSADCHGSFHIP